MIATTPTSDNDNLVTILAPVWGRRHLDRFLRLVLPSWLAAGNVPRLAQNGAVGVRFLSRTDDFERIRRTLVFTALARQARIEFIAIDDLLSPGFMPVSLTLAYQRGAAFGARAGVRQRLLWLNGDFLLADGALAYAGALLRQDAPPLLLAPSLRVKEEGVLPDLLEKIDRDGALAIGPRALARLALDHPHPTLTASRFDQAVLRSVNPHQLYWRADESTLIGRALCLFALGVAVDGAPPPAAAYADFGQARLMAPDAPAQVMDDSDHFLAVELSPEAYEADFIRVGAPSLEAVAAETGAWATEFHRAQAAAAIFYRAGDPGPRVAAAKTASDAVIAGLLRRMGPVQPLKEHPRWLGGVEGWRRERRQLGGRDDPPELAAVSRASAAPARAAHPLRALARAATIGPAGRRAPWHPYWALDRALRRLRARLDAEGGAPAVLGAVELLSYAPDLPAGDRPHGVLALIDLTHASGAQTALARLRAAARPGEPVGVVAYRKDGGALDPLAIVSLHYALDAWADMQTEDALALERDAVLSRRYGALADRFTLAGLARAACDAPAMLAVNLARTGRPAAQTHVTALLLRGRARLAETPAPQSAETAPAEAG